MIGIVGHGFVGKDTSAFFQYGLSNGVILNVLKAAIEENKKLRPECY